MSEEKTAKENPLRAEKRRKLEEMRAAGIDPFPHNYERTATLEKIRSDFDSIEVGEKKEDAVFKVAGRLMTKRPMGKAAFFNIQDQSGNIQVYLRKADLPEEDQKAFELIDLGDFVGVEGFVFKTTLYI